mmetsp:Transcript_14868/g.30382  ORF Transcript_14868/g.30382 Transcript_14868/m.30382 type:complete len:253 (-) Transcript_14868:198-956(-)
MSVPPTLPLPLPYTAPLPAKPRRTILSPPPSSQELLLTEIRPKGGLASRELGRLTLRSPGTIPPPKPIALDRPMRHPALATMLSPEEGNPSPTCERTDVTMCLEHRIESTASMTTDSELSSLCLADATTPSRASRLGANLPPSSKLPPQRLPLTPPPPPSLMNLSKGNIGRPELRNEAEDLLPSSPRDGKSSSLNMCSPSQASPVALLSVPSGVAPMLLLRWAAPPKALNISAPSFSSLSPNSTPLSSPPSS